MKASATLSHVIAALAAGIGVSACHGSSSPSPGPSGSGSSLIPAERLTTWNPGIPGGIPVRTQVCASINAAAFGNGAQDATAAIQAALDACPEGQVVSLSAGTFTVSTLLQIAKGIVLRGSGPTQTLVKSTASAAPVVWMGPMWPQIAASVNLTANAGKGSTTITVASTSGFAPGDLALLDELSDDALVQWGSSSPPGDPSRGWFARFDRPISQIVEIQSVTGNAITFTTPLHIGFDTAHQAQLSQYDQPAVRNAGLEDVHVYGGTNDNITLALVAYGWVKNVESEWSGGDSIGINESFRCVVRDSYFHHSPELYPGGGAYGLSFANSSADNLIENNIFWHFNKVMVMRASGGGNVIGYNYFEDGFIGDTPLNYTQWMETGLNASHMTFPHYELFEGNEAFNIDADNSWGNSGYVTYLRNHATGKRRSFPDVDNRRAIGLMAGAWWYTFVGNVLGYPGMTPDPYTSFAYANSAPWDPDPVPMWQLGYNPEDWNAGADPRVLSSVIREGNYDYATNQVHWSNGPQDLPVSLYLSGKPAFFGDNPWPWVDPTGTTKLHTLPARARFDAMNP
jgi:Pectate lyase superfamily protein